MASDTTRRQLDFTGLTITCAGGQAWQKVIRDQDGNPVDGVVVAVRLVMAESRISHVEVDCIDYNGAERMPHAIVARQTAEWVYKGICMRTVVLAPTDISITGQVIAGYSEGTWLPPDAPVDFRKLPPKRAEQYLLFASNDHGAEGFFGTWPNLLAAQMNLPNEDTSWAHVATFDGSQMRVISEWRPGKSGERGWWEPVSG